MGHRPYDSPAQQHRRWVLQPGTKYEAASLLPAVVVVAVADVDEVAIDDEVADAYTESFE